MTVPEAEEQIGKINCHNNPITGPYDPKVSKTDQPITKVYCHEVSAMLMINGYKRAALDGYDENLLEIQEQILQADPKRESYATVDDVCEERFKRQCSGGRFSAYQAVMTAHALWGEEAESERRRRQSIAAGKGTTASPGEKAFSTFSFLLYYKYCGMGTNVTKIAQKQFQYALILRNKKMNEDALPEHEKEWTELQHIAFRQAEKGIHHDIRKLHETCFTTKKALRPKAPPTSEKKKPRAAPPTVEKVHNFTMPDADIRSILIGNEGPIPTDDDDRKEELERTNYVNALVCGVPGAGKTFLAREMVQWKAEKGFKVFVLCCGGNAIANLKRGGIQVEKAWDLYDLRQLDVDDYEQETPAYRNAYAKFCDAIEHIMECEGDKVLLMDEMIPYMKATKMRRHRNGDISPSAWDLVMPFRTANYHNKIACIVTAQQYMDVSTEWRRASQGNQAMAVFLNMGVGFNVNRTIYEDQFNQVMPNARSFISYSTSIWGADGCHHAPSLEPAQSTARPRPRVLASILVLLSTSRRRLRRPLTPAVTKKAKPR